MMVEQTPETSPLSEKSHSPLNSANTKTPIRIDSLSIADCRDIMETASKSFSLATVFFPKEKRVGARLLYGWCRHSDDQVDESVTLEEKKERLKNLIEKTESALDGEEASESVFKAIQYLSFKYGMPAKYPLDLLEGMRWDLEKSRYSNYAELKQYCYYVAGTVGMMMAYVMGVKNPKAYRYAVHMGIAMQMTNIARDVVEDFERDRIYLPSTWIKRFGYQKDDEIFDPKNRHELAQVVNRLLNVAEHFYRSGERGLRYLDFGSAVSVCIARYVYGAIGAKVRRRGAHAWDTRTYVGKLEKLWWVLRGGLLAGWSSIRRYFGWYRRLDYREFTSY